MEAANAHRWKNLLRAGLVLLVTLSWSYLAAAFLLTNPFGTYPVYRLNRVLLAASASLILILASVFVFTRLITPYLDQAPQKEILSLLLASGALGLLLLSFFPVPWPALPREATLQIAATGAKNPAAKDSLVEIRNVRDFNGTAIPFKYFLLNGEWQGGKDRLISNGQPAGSTAGFTGRVSGGIVFTLRHNSKAGIVQVTVNGRKTEYDLYSFGTDDLRTETICFSFQDLSTLQKGLIGAILLLHFLGLASLVFALGAVAGELTQKPRRSSLVTAFLCVAIFFGFAAAKFAYLGFNSTRAFRDTASYAVTAEKPLTSWAFWSDERSFSLPLEFKLLGVRLSNYDEPGIRRRVADFQTWLSIFCWTALAAAFSRCLRQRWLAPLALGIILFFSLGLEVSLWDPFLLSESLSFSLFALLLAFWILYETLPKRFHAGPLAWGYFGSMAIVSILYSFTRDTNLYFVLLGALFLAVAVLVRRPSKSTRGFYLAYAVVALLLFFFQNATVQYGNRWQVLFYDHLALRILPDAEATSYFRAAGLPVTPELQKIQSMRGVEYQQLLMKSPQMEPVRQWVELHGRSTFLSYLLSHPQASILEPLRQIGSLLNGSTLSYRYSENPEQIVPWLALSLSQKSYPHQAAALLLLAACPLLGLLLWGNEQPVWWILAFLVLSLLPLMLLVWNGNPMEIERHAAQIGIQVRLAGWMAILLLTDRYLSQHLITGNRNVLKS